MRKFYTDQKVLLRENLKMATIIKKHPSMDEKYIASYYDSNNVLKYAIIDDIDIIDEAEYNIIRNRINSINELLKGL